MTHPDPYLSIVVAARNDDHGGGLLGRMQVFVDALVAQCDRHGLSAELVFVEWNPPADRPRLREAIRWPSGSDLVTVRIIEVPPQLHSRFEHSESLPLFQMIAKNAGIRRARAPFVLATNIDLLFSDGVMRALASRQLGRGHLYRADRYDVEAGVPTDTDVSEQLGWCARHVLRINSRRGTEDLQTGAFYPIYAGSTDLPRYLWRRLDLARELDLARGDFRGRATRTIRRRVRRHLIEKRRRLRRGGTESRSALRTRLASARRTIRRARVRPHTNACGDFTLMAREHWLALRGYPELEMYSLHIDSLLLYMSRYAGIRELVLRDPVFHIEHGTGFKPDDEGRRELFRWLADGGVPWITNERFGDFVVEMAETRRPLDRNGGDWGLGSESLPEEVFGLA